jgi:hypothetical protein
MVKDSTKYASTNGWGFAQFTDGKPADEAALKGCSPCHEPAKSSDFVSTPVMRLDHRAFVVVPAEHGRWLSEEP